MKYFNSFLATIFLISLMIVLISCSTGNTPIEPENPSGNISDIPDYSTGQSENRTVVASYNATIDTNSKTFTISPYKRTTAFHYELTQDYPDILTITGYGFTPNFWVDIKLSHPLPTSGVDVFDPRVIAILPANDGVSVNFPNLDLLTNNSVLLEPDGYTKLWDNLSIPGSANPFIAYFKDQSYRQWSSIYPQNETKRWQMDIDGFGGPLEFEFVVDISTNYPEIPYPYTDNAPEPVQIELTIGDGMTNEGGSADINAIITDWQGQGTIGGVSIEAPDLFDGTVSLDFVEQVDTYDYKYTGTISNENLASSGEYPVLISSWDVDTGIRAYNLFMATVFHSGAFDFQDVTPFLISFECNDFAIYGDYAIVIGRYRGFYSEKILLIYDISDTSSPRFVTEVYTYNVPRAIEVDGDYLYLSSYTSGGISFLEILDISNPQAPTVVKTIDIERSIAKLKVYDNYLYAMHSLGIILVDINPPESATVLSQILSDVEEFEIVNGFLYILGSYGFKIYEYDPPYHCQWIKTYWDWTLEGGFCINEGYAYILDTFDNKLHIIDIDPPSGLSLVNKLDGFPPRAFDSCKIITKDDYLYILSFNSSPPTEVGLYIYDISDRENPVYVDTLPVASFSSSYNSNCKIINDTIIYTSLNTGINFIDISDPPNAHRLSEIFNHGVPAEAYPDGDYLYVANSIGLQILDITTPESAYLVKTVISPRAWDVRSKDGYAYLACNDHGLKIIDVDPVEDAHVINTITVNGGARDVALSGNYLYVGGLTIIGIEDPENAQLIREVHGVPGGNDVAAANGFAYISHHSYGMFMVDVDPPESAYLIGLIEFGDANGVDVQGDYVYICDEDTGFVAVDVSDPSTPVIVDTVWMGDSRDMAISSGFAFVAASWEGAVRVVDISDPGNLEIVYTFPLEDLNHLSIQNNYAYCASWLGMKIIKLW